MLERAGKQQQTLMEFLALSHWDTLITTPPLVALKRFTREELMNASHCTAANIKALTDRKILYTYDKEVGRLNNDGEPHPENIKKPGTAAGCIQPGTVPIY